MAPSARAGDTTGEIAVTVAASERGARLLASGRSGLPSGPPLASFVQAAIWALRPLALMDRCAARYGEIFTLRVRRRPWVLLSNPQHVKQVFTTDTNLLRAGAGEANPLLGPLLGPRSVMLLDEPRHMGDRKRLLPSFHGQRMKDYGAMMDDVAREQIARWPIGEPFELWPVPRSDRGGPSRSCSKRCTSGVRRCVAASLAQLEMKRVIKAVLGELELRPADASSEGPMRSSVSFAPDGGARVVAARRARAAGEVLAA
jgi:cytochrome P450